MSPWAVEHDLNRHLQHHHFDGTTVSNGKLLSEWSHDETAVVCKETHFKIIVKFTLSPESFLTNF